MEVGGGGRSWVVVGGQEAASPEAIATLAPGWHQLQWPGMYILPVDHSQSRSIEPHISYLPRNLISVSFTTKKIKKRAFVMDKQSIKIPTSSCLDSVVVGMECLECCLPRRGMGGGRLQPPTPPTLAPTHLGMTVEKKNMRNWDNIATAVALTLQLKVWQHFWRIFSILGILFKWILTIFNIVY